MHECWHNMFTYGKYKRMNVETSKHDELWTINVVRLHNIESNSSPSCYTMHTRCTLATIRDR